MENAPALPPEEPPPASPPGATAVVAPAVNGVSAPPAAGRARPLALLELIVVTAIAFGPTTWRSTVDALGPDSAPLVIDDRGLLAGLREQLVLLAVVGGGLLLARRRKLADFRPQITWRLTALGVGLYLFVLALGAGLDGLVHVLGESLPLDLLPQEEPWDSRGLSPAVASVFSLVNGAWEELLLLGYLFRAAEGLWSRRVAFLLSLGVRLAYHTYQGLAGLAWVALFGVVVGAGYLSSRRVWPAIVAHVLADVVGLLGLLA